MNACMFVLSKKCRWGDPGDEIQVGELQANRLTQDGYGERKSDIETRELAKKKNPDAIEAAKKATEEAESEIAEKAKAEEKEEHEKALKKADEKSKQDAANTGGPNGAEIQNKGSRSMAKG